MSKIADRALKGIFFTMLLFVLFFASGCAGECDACHQYERQLQEESIIIVMIAILWLKCFSVRHNHEVRL